MAKQIQRVIIDLGKGVIIEAPFKTRWTPSEWKRMTAFMDKAIGNHNPEIERFK